MLRQEGRVAGQFEEIEIDVKTRRGKMLFFPVKRRDLDLAARADRRVHVSATGLA